eukprot:CAMPEP_0197494418 /NCGR_PEP_ID=MMETSP1311-20131121/29795_1 /TAXON_ID=464262 /ORGANISM="Genus nov. species nov., Strain RCC856" /LENGTH=368 /DNA_ID=CAMNT_0043039801 /DNA_START=21 /DNA_END=1127 /DNA_ORIENTATION=-
MAAMIRIRSTSAATIACAFLALASLLAVSVAASPVDLKIYGCLEEGEFGNSFPNGHCPHHLDAYDSVKEYHYPHISILNSGSEVEDLTKYKTVLENFSKGSKHWEPEINSLIVHGPKAGSYQVELSGGTFHHHDSTIEKLVSALDRIGLKNNHGAKGEFAGYHIQVPSSWVSTTKSPPELHDKSRQYLEGKDSKLKWYLGDQKLGVDPPIEGVLNFFNKLDGCLYRHGPMKFIKAQFKPSSFLALFQVKVHSGLHCLSAGLAHAASEEAALRRVPLDPHGAVPEHELLLQALLGPLLPLSAGPPQLLRAHSQHLSHHLVADRHFANVRPVLHLHQQLVLAVPHGQAHDRMDRAQNCHPHVVPEIFHLG